MSNANIFTLEIIVRGRWVVASRRWSAVERDAFLRTNTARTDVRFV